MCHGVVRSPVYIGCRERLTGLLMAFGTLYMSYMTNLRLGSLTAMKRIDHSFADR